jgi:HAE1 family hydrophobic/amphiphilic exporter-1
MGTALNSLVKITGYNSQKLREIAERALAQIEKNRRVRNPRITTGSRFGRATQEEVVITVHRDRLATHGLTVLEVVRHLRQLLGVDTPWSMLLEGENERVQLSFYDSESLEYSDAVQTLVRTSEGRMVRIADLVSIETLPLSGEITREDQRYASYLNWEYIGTDQMRQAYMKSVLESLDLPYGYDAEESRREFFTEEEEGELVLAITLAVIFIFMVLAAVFESISLPFLVLVSVPMALVGVFFAFWWTNSAFDSSAKIGLILLFGIVVNNAILLLSRFRTESTLILKAKLGGDPGGQAALFPGLKKDLGGSDLWNLPAHERGGLLHRAIARATRIRLRSILLTSGTTIVGLAPLLVHFRETQDKDIWENLALASIGGLASSTILILFTLPALYYMCVRFDWAVLRHVRLTGLLPLRGRFNRSEYFATTFMIVLLTVLLVAAIGAAIILKGPGKETAFLVAKFLSPLGLVAIAPACVKRLHDLGKPGWHLWLLFVPLYNVYLVAKMVFARGLDGASDFGASPADASS